MASEYALPKFQFRVEWQGSQVGFTEVSGLDFETEVIEYRHGASKEYHKTKQPGMTKFTNITLKRGIFQSDNEFFDWWKNNRMFNSPERRDITISMLNDSHEPVVVWNVKGAWPVKIAGTDLKADDNNVAIETMELAHECLVVEHK